MFLKNIKLLICWSISNFELIQPLSNKQKQKQKQKKIQTQKLKSTSKFSLKYY